MHLTKQFLHHQFLELGLEENLKKPLSDINKVIKALSERDSEYCTILLIDEVFAEKENESWNDFELSYCDLTRPNINLLLAFNPLSLSFKNSYKVILPQHPNTMACQLFVRHRNNYATSVLISHWKAAYESILGYVDSSNDVPLNPEILPPGRLPLWIQRRENVSYQEVIDFIKSKHVYDHETVTLIYDEELINDQQKNEINQICTNNGWKSLDRLKIYGFEDQVVVILDLIPTPEQITRAKNALIFVTIKG